MTEQRSVGGETRLRVRVLAGTPREGRSELVRTGERELHAGGERRVKVEVVVLGDGGEHAVVMLLTEITLVACGPKIILGEFGDSESSSSGASDSANSQGASDSVGSGGSSDPSSTGGTTAGSSSGNGADSTSTGGATSSTSTGAETGSTSSGGDTGGIGTASETGGDTTTLGSSSTGSEGTGTTGGSGDPPETPAECLVIDHATCYSGVIDACLGQGNWNVDQDCVDAVQSCYPIGTDLLAASDVIDYCSAELDGGCLKQNVGDCGERFCTCTIGVYPFNWDNCWHLLLVGCYPNVDSDCETVLAACYPGATVPEYEQCKQQVMEEVGSGCNCPMCSIHEECKDALDVCLGA